MTAPRPGQERSARGFWNSDPGKYGVLRIRRADEPVLREQPVLLRRHSRSILRPSAFARLDIHHLFARFR